MDYSPDDTIVALSSATGPGGRAIIRLSGPQAIATASCVVSSPPIDATTRQIRHGEFVIAGIARSVPGDVFVYPDPHSYTGQTVVELQLVSCPPIVERLLSDLMSAGARAAKPGEFTLRAFLAGKVDLPKAEAVLKVIMSRDRDEMRQSLEQLAGGSFEPLRGLREQLLNLLADVEAGLDFVAEDIEFVSKTVVLTRLTESIAHLTLVRKKVEERALTDRPFRVAIVGRPNVGKSRLFNALSGATALVSDRAGTTRDYLVARVKWDGKLLELIDTAGLRFAADDIEDHAQSAGRVIADEADLILHCEEAGVLHLNVGPGINVLRVTTKCDVAASTYGDVATSVVTGAGLADLRRRIVQIAMKHQHSQTASSLSRCRPHIDSGINHLREAHRAALFDDPAEVVANDIRAAVEQIGAITGEVYTNELLDRIFGRFCIGK